MSEWSPEAWEGEVEQMTTMMRRSSAFPFWPALRNELQQRGIDAQQALLVESYDEPPRRIEHGVVVTAERRVIAYHLDGDQWNWNDLTDRWEASEWAAQIRVGLAMVERDS